MTDDVKQLWQSQQTEGPALDLEDIRRRARRAQRVVALRNLISYASMLIVILGYGFYVLALDGVFVRLGCFLVVLGAFYCAISLSAQGGSRRAPAQAPADSYLQFHRRELERQRTFVLRSVRLMVLPITPGFAMLLIAAPIELQSWSWTDSLIVAGAFIGIVAVSLPLVRLRVNRLSRMLEELHRLGAP